MYRSQVKEIIEDLKKTKKAIVAIGCSFVQGQGAVNDELYINYPWEFHKGIPLDIQVSASEQATILKNYPLVGKSPNGKLDFTFMGYANSFVNILCKKYFNGTYTPINLGTRGCGNRGSIKELYFYPDIDWGTIDEIIVLYVPSGLERFDFINDQSDDHFNWKCMWPYYKDMPASGKRTLWEGYARTVSSDKFEVMEQLSHVQELVTWCNYNNAKLIVTPGFDRRYDEEYFRHCLASEVVRSGDEEFIKSSAPLFIQSATNKEHLIKLFPWDAMFKPDGFTTFVDLVISKEDIPNKHDHYNQFLGKGSPDRWITPCSHPSAKGHELFAQHLHNHILNGIK